MFASLLAASLGSNLGRCGSLIDAAISVGLAMPSGSSPSLGFGEGWTINDWVIVGPLPCMGAGPRGPNGPRGPRGPVGAGCLGGSIIGVEDALAITLTGLLRGS